MKYPFIIALFLLEIIFLKFPGSSNLKIDFSKFANYSDVSIQVWTTEKGLPSNDIYDIVKGENGFYYLGTSNGFVRFDGTEFKVYNTKTRNKSKRMLREIFYGPSRKKFGWATAVWEY